MKKNPLSLQLQEHSPYVYIFAHPRTADDGVTKRMLWQPRLTKPEAQTNSYLFRAVSHTDLIRICWLIPPPELWDQYTKGKVSEHDTVVWSVSQFKKNKKELESPDPQDLPDEKIRMIYSYIKSNRGTKYLMDNLYSDKTKRALSEESSAFYE